jgi:hypothetical protein
MGNENAGNEMFSISQIELQDKIKGGWAGQTIGCTFGGPTEFRYNGTMIQDYQPIEWYDGYLKETYLNNPGLYDDIYMDLTFVDVFEKEGLDAPVSSFAKAFAEADYWLWHANQAARYNILNGIEPPASGHWLNNPHADDIDYQIEADFAGLMSPGMPNTASEISDKIGHIMNYGDGWYGGVFVGAMYSLAFISDDVGYIVEEALKTIPEQSQFYQCIADVISWHQEFPDDWKRNWFEIEKKWSQDIGCPDGVFRAFNIDAKINAAYIVLGLLYGEGDFGKTLEISTRAGQDSDCNPASAGGILGTVLGYNNIPAFWKQGLTEAEPLEFKYTTFSLNNVYETGLRHALQVITRNGGKVEADSVRIQVQKPEPVRLEQSFEGHFPIELRRVNRTLETEQELEFEGIGFVIKGRAAKNQGIDQEYIFQADVYVDGEKIETIPLPTDFRARRHELAWKYQLPEGKHRVKLVLLNPSPDHKVEVHDLLVYGKKQS